LIELGQLEKQHEEFDRRKTRVIAISLEGADKAAETQKENPHLLVLADQGRGLSEAAKVIHPQAAPDGSDAAMPTTILVDRQGVVHWIHRPSEIISRLSPQEVLQLIDQHMPPPK
jgi:peroxiredoxin